MFLIGLLPTLSLCHGCLLKAKVYFVTGLIPQSVFCKMVYSKKTGADIFTSAIIECTNGATILGKVLLL